MPTFFEIRSKETKGYTTLYVRLQSRLHKVNYKMSTGLEVEISAWNKAKKSSTAMNSYHDKNPELWGKLDRLKLTLNSLLDGDKAPTKEEMKQAINTVMHAPVQEEKKRAQEQAKKVARQIFDEDVGQILEFVLDIAVVFLKLVDGVALRLPVVAQTDDVGENGFLFVEEVVLHLVFVFAEEAQQDVLVVGLAGVGDAVEVLLDVRDSFAQVIIVRSNQVGEQP